MVDISDIMHQFFFLIGVALECLLLYAIATRTPKKTMQNIQDYLFLISISKTTTSRVFFSSLVKFVYLSAIEF